MTRSAATLLQILTALLVCLHLGGPIARATDQITPHTNAEGDAYCTFKVSDDTLPGGGLKGQRICILCPSGGGQTCKAGTDIQYEMAGDPSRKLTLVGAASQICGSCDDTSVGHCWEVVGGGGPVSGGGTGGGSGGGGGGGSGPSDAAALAIIGGMLILLCLLRSRLRPRHGRSTP